MIDTKNLRQRLEEDGKRNIDLGEIHELLDRLEDAERVRDVLRAENETLAANLRGKHSITGATYAHLIAERDALLAKVEAMEKQEPVGRALLCVRCSTPFDGEHYCPACGHHTATEEAVYAIPGAQPAPSVPEGWKLVPVEPTPGMIDAAEYVDWGDADVRGSCINAWDRMLAAAPEAKP